MLALVEKFYLGAVLKLSTGGDFSLSDRVAIGTVGGGGVPFPCPIDVAIHH